MATSLVCRVCKKNYEDEIMFTACRQCRDKLNIATVRHNMNMKLKAIEIGGGKCSRCNFDNPAALQFHHRDPKIKSFNVNTQEISLKRWSIVEEEITKCDLLCANCHAIEHCTWKDLLWL